MLDNVAPEEFGIDARTHSYDPADAQFAYHQTEMTRSQLIEAGYDRATVDALPSGGAAADSEELSRYDKTDDDMTWPLARGRTRDIPWDLGDLLLNCWSPKRLGMNRAREPLARLGHPRAGPDELVAHELDDSA